MHGSRPGLRPVVRLLVPSACLLLVLVGLPLLSVRGVGRDPGFGDVWRALSQANGRAGSSTGQQQATGQGTAARSSGAPTVRAPTALVVDVRTGRVLFAKNPDQRRPIASVAKIMTAMLVLEHSDLSDVVRVSRRAASAPPIDIGLKPRQRITVGHLMWGLLLWSGNDASVALAEHVSGTVAAFRRLMNERARELGLNDTYFASPSGLDDRGFSTVRDVAVLARAALANKTFAAMVATPRHWIPGPRSQIHRLRNLNDLLRRYRGAIGVKTGYTQAAGNCVVGAASRSGHTLIAVVLGDPPRTQWRAAYSDVRRLLDYGFALELQPQAGASGLSIGIAGRG
jgi:D-alanyl-D-alanine carboxypeptidase (penicillin-binding protein 5/6)